MRGEGCKEVKRGRKEGVEVEEEEEWWVVVEGLDEW